MAKTPLEIALERRKKQQAQSAAAAGAAPVYGGGGGGGYNLPALGGVTLGKEIAGGVTALAKLGAGFVGDVVTGNLGKAGGKLGMVAKGLGGSVLGTAATPFAWMGNWNPVEQVGDALLGEGAVKDTFERVGERGILPALFEDVGNVAIVGAVAKGALTAGMKAAETGAVAGKAGALEKAAKLGRYQRVAHEASHPYMWAGRQVRPRLKAAQDVVAGVEARPLDPTSAARAANDAEKAALRAEHRASRAAEAARSAPEDPGGILASQASDMAEAAVKARSMADETMAAANDTAGRWVAGETVVARESVDAMGRRVGAASAGEVLQRGKLRDLVRESVAAVNTARKGLPGEPGALTRVGAAIEGFAQARETSAFARQQERLMEAARTKMLRSEPVNTAINAAQEFVIGRTNPATGKAFTAQEASQIVGDEAYARLSGMHQLVEKTDGLTHEMLLGADGAPGPRKHLAPQELRANAEWQRAMENVTQKMREEHARTLDIFKASRLGEEGLEQVGMDTINLLPKEERALAQAYRELERAGGLERRIAKAREVQQRRIDGASDSTAAIGERLRRLNEERAGALAAFDENRLYVPKAWQNAAARTASYQAIVGRTLESWRASGGKFGGASFNPHTGSLFNPHAGAGGRFIEAGEKVYAVGVVNETAVKVHISQLTPDHVDQMVRAYQELFENQEVMVGTWVDKDGYVHIDPSQVLSDLPDAPLHARDRALSLAAARAQEAIWDNGAMDELAVPLNHRPDVAGHFADRHKFRDTQAGKLRGAARDGRHRITDIEVDRMMAVTDLMATRAWELGKVSHPDVWYDLVRYDVKKGRKFLRKGMQTEALQQTYLKREYNPRLWDDVVEYLGPEQLDTAMQWYYRSHQWVRDSFRGKQITLADGIPRAADEVFFQILAVTSIQASPTTNLGNALKATANINKFMDAPEMRAMRERLAGTLKKASDEGWSHLQLWEELFPEVSRAGSSKAMKKAAFSTDIGEALVGTAEGSKARRAALKGGEVYEGMVGLNAHMYDMGKTLVWEILTGNTIDKWNAQVISDVALSWYKKGKMTEPMRKALVAFGGNEARMMEHYGGQLWAKLRSFHSNLADPYTSQLATLDSWMARLLDLENWDKPGVYAKYAQKIRDMATYATETMGRTVQPHEIQAALWAYSKLQIGRQNWGRLMAATGDTMRLIESGKWTPDADPLLAWHADDLAGTAEALGRKEANAALAKAKREAKKAGEPPPTGSKQAVWRVESRQISRADVRPMELPPKGPERTALRKRLGEELGLKTGKGRPRAMTEAELSGWASQQFHSELRGTKPRRERQWVAHETQPKKIENITKSEAKYRKVQEQVALALEQGDRDLATSHVIRFALDKKNAILDEEWGDFNTIAANMGAEDLTMARRTVAGQGFEQLTDEAVLARAEGKAVPGADDAATLARAERALDESALTQHVQNQILGEMLPTETRYIIKLFRDADFTTLVHENGHVLRRMLPEGQMAKVERAYGVREGRWTREHEERFADDFVNYMANYGRVGAMIPSHIQPLESIFESVRSSLAQYWPQAQHLVTDQLPPDMARVFDSWLNPNRTARPEGIVGLDLRQLPERTGQRLATREELANRAPDIPLGSPKEAFRRGARGQQALRRVDALNRRIDQTQAALTNAEKHLDEMRRLLDEHQLPAELRQAELRASAVERLQRIEGRINEAPGRQWPRAWQPLGEALEHIRRQVADQPELAAVLGDLPENFSQTMRFAMEKGFMVEHVADMTPQQVQKLVFGSMKIGKPALGDVGEEIAAGQRKMSAGVLRKEGRADRSVEALAAATVQAMHEARTNALVSFIEERVARPIPADGRMPPGWAVWDGHRHLLLTGEKLPSGATQTGRGATTMVPRQVAMQLRRMSQDYSHWSQSMLGKVTQGWRTWLLTLSPRYYVNNMVANFILAQAEGVRLQDWRKAWEAFRGEEVAGRRIRYHHQGEALPIGGVHAREYLPETGGTLVGPGAQTPRQAAGQIPGMLRDVRTGGDQGSRLGAVRKITDSVARANSMTDDFARTAVYFKKLRETGGNVDEAVRASYEALVDYGNLSNFERQIVRSIVPFYSWQKGILRLVMKMPFDHPQRVAVLMGLNRVNEELAAEQFGVEAGQVPDEYKHMVGALRFRRFNPFADAPQLARPEGLAQAFHPLVSSVLRKGYAPEFAYPEHYAMTEYGVVAPTTNLPGELGEQLVTGLPQPQLAASLAGAAEFGGRPTKPAGQALGQFTGINVYTDTDMQRIRDRIAKSLVDKRLGGPGAAGAREEKRPSLSALARR